MGYLLSFEVTFVSAAEIKREEYRATSARQESLGDALSLAFKERPEIYGLAILCKIMSPKTTQGVDAWPLKVSIALQALGLLPLIIAAISMTVFRFHRVNF